jgi:hypothetical protein
MRRGCSRECSIYLVEIRASKKHLKDFREISTFEDLDNSIGDLFQAAAEKVRYLDCDQWVTNVTQQIHHPLWIKVQETVCQALDQHQSGLTPGRIKEIYRDEAIEMNSKAILAYAARQAVALGLDDDMALEHAPDIARDIIHGHIDRKPEDFEGKLTKCRDKTRFLESDKFSVDRYQKHVSDYGND